MALVGRRSVDARYLRPLWRSLASARTDRTSLRPKGSGNQGGRNRRYRRGHRAHRHRVCGHRVCHRRPLPDQRQRALVPLGQPACPLGRFRGLRSGGLADEWYGTPLGRLRIVVAPSQGPVAGDLWCRRGALLAAHCPDLSRRCRIRFRYSQCRIPDDPGGDALQHSGMGGSGHAHRDRRTLRRGTFLSGFAPGRLYPSGRGGPSDSSSPRSFFLAPTSSTRDLWLPLRYFPWPWSSGICDIEPGGWRQEWWLTPFSTRVSSFCSWFPRSDERTRLRVREDDRETPALNSDPHPGRSLVSFVSGQRLKMASA